MATPGDGSAAPIEHLGTTGVFTTTLRAALLRGEVDLVVHSGKDLPTAPVAGLQVAAFPARADPRDALIAVIRAQVTGTAGEQLGRRLAHLLLARGGAALLGRTSHEVTDPLIPAARKDGPC